MCKFIETLRAIYEVRIWKLGLMRRCASQERGCEFYPSAHMKSWVWWCEFIVLVLEGGNGWIAWAFQPAILSQLVRGVRDPALKTQDSHILEDDIRVSVFYKHRDTCTSSPPEKAL